MRRRDLVSMCACIALVVGLSGTLRAAFPTRTQSFNTNAWTGSGNGTAGTHVANQNNYGFSNTNNAGGSPGEAGGDFYYTNPATYYADTNIAGTLNLSTGLPISASGKFAFTNRAGSAQSIFIGYFNPSTLNVARNILGIRVVDGGSGTARIDAEIAYSGGAVQNAPSLVTIPAAAQIDSFQFVYNRGAAFTVTLFDTTNSTSYSATVATTNTSLDANLTAFGLSTQAGNFASADPVALFIDNVTYDVVPEPASAFLLFGFATLGLTARGRW